MRLIKYLSIIAVLAVLASCKSQPEAEKPAEKSQAAASKGDPALGKVKYDTLCASCHGPTGLGDGPAAVSLNPKPRNLEVTTRSDEELKKIIKLGGASMGLSPTMVAWGGVLNDTDIDNVVAYVRTLKP
ncbi:MAG: cytochrome c [Myxococcales bacterium]|nr:cytochrome c [Myxococcales bacterium]